MVIGGNGLMFLRCRMYRFGGVSVSLGAVLFGERLRNALFVMHVLDEQVSGLLIICALMIVALQYWQFKLVGVMDQW